MSSPRRRLGRPIESVALKLTFRADTGTAARIRKAVPSAVVRRGVCIVRIEAESPSDVAEKAKELLDVVRAVEKPRKALSRVGGRSVEN